jgi:hypothetical protein
VGANGGPNELAGIAFENVSGARFWGSFLGFAAGKDFGAT